MSKEKSRFKSLNVYVSDPKKTVIFYQELGFYIVSSISDKSTGVTHMKLSENSDFMISIFDANTEEYDGCISIVINKEIRVPCIEECEVDVKNQSFIISVP